MIDDDDYDVRAEVTLLKRLLVMLRDNGTLTERELVELAYPSVTAIEEVEDRDVL